MGQGVPDTRQTMLFSATMPAWVKSLTRKHLKSPTLVDLVGDSESGRINESIKCASCLFEVCLGSELRPIGVLCGIEAAAHKLGSGCACSCCGCQTW